MRHVYPLPGSPEAENRSLKGGRSFEPRGLEEGVEPLLGSFPRDEETQATCLTRATATLPTPSPPRKVLTDKAALVFTCNTPTQPAGCSVTTDLWDLWAVNCPVSLSSFKSDLINSSALFRTDSSYRCLPGCCTLAGSHGNLKFRGMLSDRN